VTTPAYEQFLADQRELRDVEQQLAGEKAWQELAALEQWAVAKGWLLARIAGKQTKLIAEQRPSSEDFLEIRAEIRTLSELLFVSKRNPQRVVDLETRAEDLRKSIQHAQTTHQDRDYSVRTVARQPT
jgi:hypothetical protein